MRTMFLCLGVVLGIVGMTLAYAPQPFTFGTYVDGEAKVLGGVSLAVASHEQFNLEILGITESSDELRPGVAVSRELGDLFVKAGLTSEIPENFVPSLRAVYDFDNKEPMFGICIGYKFGSLKEQPDLEEIK